MVVLRESILLSALLYYVNVWLMTEGLSLFHLLKTPEPLACLHFFAVIAFGIGAWMRRNSLALFRSELGNVKIDLFFKLLAIVILLFIFLPLLYAAVFCPPCTADSMSYHLTKVVHWMQHGNVNHYPTNYPRQIYYQPASEYLMLQWQLLSGNDFFDNTVQLFCFFLTMIGISLVIQWFGGSTLCQFFGIGVFLASPLLIFQASTTQNDIITLFLFFNVLYFGLRLCSSPTPLSSGTLFFYVVCLSVSFGMGLNTKMSVAIYIFAFFFWFLSRFLLLHQNSFKIVWKTTAIVVVCSLFFSIPYFCRNYQISGKILGPNEVQEKLRNKQHGIAPTFSNVLRNIGMQLLIPEMPLLGNSINELNLSTLQRIHKLFDIEWADTGFTYTGDGEEPYAYETRIALDDYRAGNTVIVVLFFIVSLACTIELIMKYIVSELFPKTPEEMRIREKQRRKENVVKVGSSSVWLPEMNITLYAWLVITGFLIFSSIFRWQPFGSRLMLPAFVGIIPFIAISMQYYLRKQLLVFFTLFLVGTGVTYSLICVSSVLFFDPKEANQRYGYFMLPEGPLLQPLPGGDRRVILPEGRGVVLPGGFTLLPDRRVIPSLPDGRIVLPDGCQLEPRTFLRGTDLVEAYFSVDNRHLKEAFLFQRNYKYFTTIKHYAFDYISLCNTIENRKWSRVGLAIERYYDMWEYPIWAILRNKNHPVQIRWVTFPEYQTETPNYDPHFVPDVILIDTYWSNPILADKRISQIKERYDVGEIIRFEQIIVVEIKGKNEAKKSEKLKPLEPLLKSS